MKKIEMFIAEAFKCAEELLKNLVFCDYNPSQSMTNSVVDLVVSCIKASCYIEHKGEISHDILNEIIRASEEIMKVSDSYGGISSEIETRIKELTSSMDNLFKKVELR